MNPILEFGDTGIIDLREVIAVAPMKSENGSNVYLIYFKSQLYWKIWENSDMKRVEFIKRWKEVMLYEQRKEEKNQTLEYRKIEL